MTKLEQDILESIEKMGIDGIKNNSDLWVYLNSKRSLDKLRIIPDVPIESLEELNEGISRKLKKPIAPLTRLIREGTCGTCPKCHSTEIKRFGFFGKSIGCINPKCEKYYNKEI